MPIGEVVSNGRWECNGIWCVSKSETLGGVANSAGEGEEEGGDGGSWYIAVTNATKDRREEGEELGHRRKSVLFRKGSNKGCM